MQALTCKQAEEVIFCPNLQSATYIACMADACLITNSDQKLARSSSSDLITRYQSSCLAEISATRLISLQQDVVGISPNYIRKTLMLAIGPGLS